VSPESLIERGNGNANGLGTLRQSLENDIFNEYYRSMVKYGFIAPEQVQETQATIQAMRNKLANASDAEIMNEIQKIKLGCRENGVLMMNDKGDFVQGC
jgi:hypothetical protein